MIAFAGPCWRAVVAGHEGGVLEGTVRAGRDNRAGERTLYVSGSPEGVAAAMARYRDAPRTAVPLVVVADDLIDLRDVGACAAHGIDPTRAKEDWNAALDRGEEPPSWRIADQLRATGADGLIDGSRRAPGEAHIVLFRWNRPGAPTVTVA